MATTNSSSVLVRGIDLEVHFGTKSVLKNANFELKSGEIVGIVGLNGSGKSSFLKIVAGVLEADSGRLEFKSNTKVSFVSQDFDLELENTAFQEVARGWFDFLKNPLESDEKHLLVSDLLEISKPWLHLNPIKHELAISQIQEALTKLDCPDSQKKIRDLSGGEKRKVAIAKAFVGNPDLLILDEPTNHLDIESMKFLEKALKDFGGGVLLVSHDRYFLDILATRMIEIYNGELYQHYGNYQSYLENKAIRLEIEAVEQDRRQAFLKRELNWVRAGVKARGTKDKGRLKRFYEKEDEDEVKFEQKLEPILPPIKPLGNKIIKLENVSLSVGDHKIVEKFSYDFQPKIRLGLIGKNGSGKTSFIRAILDQIPVQTGRISIGFNTEFNYQDQEKKLLNETKTAFDEIGDGDERTQFGETTIGVRSYLKRFLFDNNQINSQIKNFSGGEKARLLLAKLFKAGGNCLILDEPTNDLDLETIRLLEESLNNFEGISIVISHDRYFLNRVCNTILELKGEGKFVLSDGNYDDYLSKNRPFNFGEVEVKIKDPEKISKKEQRILQKQIRDVEKEIEILEAKIKDLEIEFTAPDFYTKTPKEITKKIIQLDDLKILLAKAMSRWEELAV